MTPTRRVTVSLNPKVFIARLREIIFDIPEYPYIPLPYGLDRDLFGLSWGGSHRNIRHTNKATQTKTPKTKHTNRSEATQTNGALTHKGRHNMLRFY